MQIKNKFFLALGFLFAFTSIAQASSDLQLWTQFVFQTRVYEKYFIYLETQPRLTHDLTQFERILARPAVGYELSPGSTAWLGYLWLPSIQSGSRYEQRFWQQYLFQEEVSPSWTLISRSRLEQRWIQGVDGTGVRIRQMVRGLYALNKDQSWSLAVWDEVLFNLNSMGAGPRAGYDQNRIFLGVSYWLDQKLRVEPGYLLNHLHLPTGDRLNHVLYLMVFWQP